MDVPGEVECSSPVRGLLFVCGLDWFTEIHKIQNYSKGPFPLLGLSNYLIYYIVHTIFPFGYMFLLLSRVIVCVEVPTYNFKPVFLVFLI